MKLFLMIKVNLLKKMFSKNFIKYSFLDFFFLYRQIIQLLKKVDVLHMKKIDSR